MDLESATDSASQRWLQQIPLLLTVIVAAIVLSFCYFASSLCIALVLSALLAILIDPVVIALGKVRLGRGLAAGLCVLGMVILLGTLTYALYQSANSFASHLRDYSYRIQQSLQPLTQRFQQLKQSAETLNPAKPAKQVPEVKVTQNWTAYLLRGMGSIWSFLAIASVSPFLTFFMLLRKEQMRLQFCNLFERKIDVCRFVDNLQGMVRAYVLGNLLVGSILAAGTAAVFLIIGLKGALALGIACGFLTLIPFLGGIAASVLALAAGLLQFDSLVPLIEIGVAVPAIHLIAVNYLIPKVIGRRLLIGPVAMMVAVLFWAWFWGVMGLLLAVPLTAFIKLVADSHPRLFLVSNLLAHEPEPVPSGILVEETTIQQVHELDPRR